MKLPNGDRARIAMEKLTGYCLNPEHSTGKHKARVFASVLGLRRKDAEKLRELISRAAVEGEVVQQNETQFGWLFKVDWGVPEQDRVILRTLWEITALDPIPRLVSAFIRD